MQPDSILGLWKETGYCIFDPSLFGIRALKTGGITKLVVSAKGEGGLKVVLKPKPPSSL